MSGGRKPLADAMERWALHPLGVFPLDPVARRLGSGKPLTEDDAIASSSALSPDGQFIAYNLKRPGIDREELWITNIVDGTSELVATDAVFPCWSPDGKTIAYNYFRTDKQPATGRVAVRQLGGKERFLSRWSTEWFIPSDWSAELGLLGTYENRVLQRIAIGSLADDTSGCPTSQSGC